ncbi:MAG: DUF2934 domain-containing protein, partial [Rhodospirillales bacterium]
NAYVLWESAGRQYGNALDYWLQAERQVLNAMTEAAAANADAPPTPSPKLQRSEGAATT